MEKVYEELDEARDEIEKLRKECRIKAELSESLKRTHNEQLIKIKDATSTIEKLTQELCEKEDEVSSTNQLYEDLKSNLKEKEATIKRLSFANNNLRSSCDEKVQKYEQEIRMLATALEETNTKCVDQEQHICLLKEEVEQLKGVVSVSQKKLSEAEKTAKMSKDLRQRDDLLHNLEEEKRKFEDQLKWKKEQFNHLEEAHDKLRHQYKVKEKEWEKERDTLLDEISTLQTKLDSQIRISEGLHNRLQMCNQALAHEESKRKYLEIQLSESRTCFDNVLSEYEEAKSKIESLTGDRDKEIASLRDSLGTKETLYKEMEYQLRRSEQEKQELLLSLKELQEARIQEASSSSSLIKLRNKLRALEQVHRECSTILKAKEAEWRSQSEQLTEDLDCCKSELESKNISIQELKIKVDQVHRECAKMLEDNEAQWSSQLENMEKDLSLCRSELQCRNTFVKELQREVEACDSLIFELALQNEESSLMFLVLRSEFSEAQIKLVNDYADMDLKNKESKESLSLLLKQLEMKNTALLKAQKDIEEEREKVACLSRKVESLNLIKEQQLPLQKEFSRQQEMLNESDESRLHLQEQLLSMKRDLNKVHDALERANEELAEKLCEANESEFELQIWISIAEQLKASLEENRKMRREVEASLLAEAEIEINLKQEKERLAQVIEGKDNTICGLQEKLIMLNDGLKTRNKEIICHSEAAKEKSLSEDLKKEVEWLEQEWMRKELEGAILAQVDAERYHKEEKESLHHLVEERDQRIDDFQQLVSSLEQEFNSSTSSFASKLSKMQVEINVFREAWEKITTAEVLKEIEIQESNLIIAELESNLSCLQEQVEQLEKSLLSSEEKREELEAELETKQLEVENLTCKLEDTMNLSSERENLLGTMEGLYDRINMLSGEDMQLMETLASMVQTFDTNGLERDLKKEDDVFDPIKENMNLYPSPVTKKVEAILDERSPLRALNN